MHKQFGSEAGVSLVETMVAMLVLTVGAIGMAGLFLQGANMTTSSPNEVIATQKASEAIESVFSARDAHTLTWAQLRSTSVGGVFLPGPKTMKVAGPDGILNTGDDGAVESVELPGPDQLLGTGDDRTQVLAGFYREIQITDLTDDLRSVTVIITYPAGNVTRTYSLTAYISAFA